MHLADVRGHLISAVSFYSPRAVSDTLWVCLTLLASAELVEQSASRAVRGRARPANVGAVLLDAGLLSTFTLSPQPFT